MRDWLAYVLVCLCLFAPVSALSEPSIFGKGTCTEDWVQWTKTDATIDTVTMVFNFLQFEWPTPESEWTKTSNGTAWASCWTWSPDNQPILQFKFTKECVATPTRTDMRLVHSTDTAGARLSVAAEELATSTLPGFAATMSGFWRGTSHATDALVTAFWDDGRTVMGGSFDSFVTPGIVGSVNGMVGSLHPNSWVRFRSLNCIP